MDFQTNSKFLREVIRRLERKLGLLDELEASCCGVTFAQCHAVVEIGRAGSISLNDLAATLALDKSTMNRTINHLVTHNLATREIDPRDRRYIMIQLTPSGRKAFQTIENSMEAFLPMYSTRFPKISGSKSSIA
ncbi:DNA-binding MarR family transcriptional regulator [Hydrogenispora ethanolica]|uniref:DNA-binding MarR family transcriptional regulator n=1 Tax=Hydrogenispora ethanolica TaxID=1082276 RepID=A0A4V6NGQ1_HYDET|nr:DNA-binding MarR family transcriptional regulator [Hydrogenispora ethanolica]